MTIKQYMVVENDDILHRSKPMTEGEGHLVSQMLLPGSTGLSALPPALPSAARTPASVPSWGLKPPLSSEPLAYYVYLLWQASKTHSNGCLVSE